MLASSRENKLGIAYERKIDDLVMNFMPYVSTSSGIYQSGPLSRKFTIFAYSLSRFSREINYKSRAHFYYFLIKYRHNHIICLYSHFYGYT